MLFGHLTQTAPTPPAASPHWRHTVSLFSYSADVERSVDVKELPTQAGLATLRSFAGFFRIADVELAGEQRKILGLL